ncbi:rod shape-determining protein MreC [Hydrogenobacter hydrogenophilus]|uniref:Cell shape-determining protein MreC n=1 Tax=Hydrogenobacter hydrogenophilus TaxID=35835 RepID=A0A285P112_9AQUI|nr:rod shape-determining protein MreC [Hydrogenobacter hydrogenophilus]SNZ15148.1 rod shape-determining protein MreC [Hydrogenobacter hydrogenophilus]
MGRKRWIIYLSLILLNIFLYFSNISSSKYLSFLFDILYSILMPVIELKTQLANTMSNSVNRYIYLVNVEKTNRELLKQVQELYLYKSQLRICETSLKSLSELMDIQAQNYIKDIVFAGVVGYDPSGMDTFVLIDKGKDQGIEEGFVVFFKDRFVGIVDKVFGSSSRVRTVYSKDLTVSSTTESTGKSYIYKGGWRYGQLLYVNLEDPIEKGNLVLLRDNRKVIPAFIIGTVLKSEQRNDQFFKKVLVLPSVDIRKLEYVVVIKARL